MNLTNLEIYDNNKLMTNSSIMNGRVNIIDYPSVDVQLKMQEKIGVKNENNVVFTCGSGITATVLGLAYSIINDKYLPIIYDGSWAEYGRFK